MLIMLNLHNKLQDNFVKELRIYIWNVLKNYFMWVELKDLNAIQD